ncbi:hypothetical protein GF130_10890 [Escherichia coli]|nr:hypothetical protein [Escherichia coli]
MSRFVLGNCIDVMARIPDNAIDFILTDPPYLVGFRDRSGRAYFHERRSLNNFHRDRVITFEQIAE